MRSPTLLVKSGLFQGSKYVVDNTFQIGRHPNNQLHLADKKVSRFHAVIETSSEGCRIRDLGSLNGTWVNGRLVEHATLQAGDEIQVGQTRLEFFFEALVEKPSLQETFFSLVSEEPPAVHVRFRSPAEPALAWVLPPELESVSEENRQDYLTRLKTFYQANILLSSEMELQEIFRQILEQLLHFLPADRGVLLLQDSKTQELRISYSLARSGKVSPGELMLSRTIVREVLQEGLGLLVDDAQSDKRLSLSDSIVEQDIRSALCVPLTHQGDTLGMIYMDTLGRSSAFTEDDLQMLTAMAAPAAVQIRNCQYLEQLNRSYLDSIRVLANAIEARDHYTVGHTWRVTRFTLAMADQLGWSGPRRRYAEMGGILHDIGKIAVEDAILRKLGPLTPEEFRKMQLHPEHGARILKDVEFLKPVIPYVLFHQERWDGKGYPFRLKGEDVPMEGRLLAVCDAFDAMTSHRPYRMSLTAEEAVKEIDANRGRQFDPQLVDVFLQVWEAGEIDATFVDYDRYGSAIQCPFCSTHIPIGSCPQEGSALECPVCAKNCVLLMEQGIWRGELM